MIAVRQIFRAGFDGRQFNRGVVSVGAGFCDASETSDKIQELDFVYLPSAIKILEDW
jgi:hypothetical protein